MIFLFDAAQLKTARRKRDAEVRALLSRLAPVCACRLEGRVFEAQAGESLHAQIRLRIAADDEGLPESLRQLALTVAVEDGFTMESEAS
jgi:hypothetical protein